MDYLLAKLKSFDVAGQLHAAKVFKLSAVIVRYGKFAVLYDTVS